MKSIISRAVFCLAPPLKNGAIIPIRYELGILLLPWEAWGGNTDLRQSLLCAPVLTEDDNTTSDVDVAEHVFAKLSNDGPKGYPECTRCYSRE